MLCELRGGAAVRELGEAYSQVIEGVKKTGKKGVISLELTIKPDGKGEVTTVEVIDDVKKKVPSKDRKPTTYFVTEENTLSRSDPTQEEFPVVTASLAKAQGE